MGLIGGLSWESTQEYYHLINKEVNKRLGRNNAASMYVYSFNFEEIATLQRQNNWPAMNARIIEEVNALERAGADFFAICSNTMHKYLDEILLKVSIPCVSITQATALEVSYKGISKIGLLGTKYTMESDFYVRTMAEHGIETLIPEPEERDAIHHIIFQELTKAQLNPNSRQKLIQIVDTLAQRGASGIVLGCTELPLLLKQENTQIPLFDTMNIHVQSIVNKALE